MKAVFQPCNWCHEPTFRGRLHIECGQELFREYENLGRVNDVLHHGLTDFQQAQDRSRKRLRELTRLLKEAEPLLDRGRKMRQIRGQIRKFLGLD